MYGNVSFSTRSSPSVTVSSYKFFYHPESFIEIERFFRFFLPTEKKLTNGETKKSYDKKRHKTSFEEGQFIPNNRNKKAKISLPSIGK